MEEKDKEKHNLKTIVFDESMEYIHRVKKWSYIPMVLFIYQVLNHNLLSHDS